jgi:hypothetical protein
MIDAGGFFVQPAFFQFGERAASRLKQALKLFRSASRASPRLIEGIAQRCLPGVYPRSPSLKMKERRARSASRIDGLSDLFKEFPSATDTRLYQKRNWLPAIWRDVPCSLFGFGGETGGALATNLLFLFLR